MTTAKLSLFSNDLQLAASLFKALSHPARLAIIKYLAGTKVCMTGDICEEVPLSRTTVNQHLKELKESGFIKGTIEGVKVNYCLNPAKFEELKKIFDSYFAGLNLENNQNC